MRGSKLVKVLGLTTLIGGLAFGSVALARGPGGMHGGPGGHMAKVIEKLDLDPEQQALAKELKAGMEDEREAIQAQHEESFEALLTELGKESPDSEALHTLIDEGAALMAERMHAGLDSVLELHATFTEEQRATLVEEMEAGKEMREARREELQERHGERGERGPR